MAQRLANITRIDASSVQGDGAYVELRKFSWGEQKAIARKFGDESAVNAEAMIAELESLLIDHLVAWNWVDENGSGLPLPKSSSALDALHDDEIGFLLKSIKIASRGLSESERKN